MMTFSFGSAEALQQSFLPILIFSLVLTMIIGSVIYKAFGVNKWATIAGGVLVLTASATFSSVNLSTIFYQLQLNKNSVILSFAFPYQQQFSQTFNQYKYVDAITPDPNKDRCHVVLEDITGMIYQSMDIAVSDCEHIQKELAAQLQLKPRPPKPKSIHTPPLPPEDVKK
jgi:hypothetical protein